MRTLTIQLSQGKVALVDADDWARVRRYKWYWASNDTGNGYARRSIIQDGKRVPCWLHRFILGVPDAILVDHINGDGLDCRKANLRMASHGQNIMNQSVSRRSTSGFKNVIYGGGGRYQIHPITKPWRVVVTVRAKRYSFGHWDSAEEAARIADAAMVRLHGEFARPNFTTLDPDAMRFVDERLAAKRRGR